MPSKWPYWDHPPRQTYPSQATNPRYPLPSRSHSRHDLVMKIKLPHPTPQNPPHLQSATILPLSQHTKTLQTPPKPNPQTPRHTHTPTKPFKPIKHHLPFILILILILKPHPTNQKKVLKSREGGDSLTRASSLQTSDERKVERRKAKGKRRKAKGERRKTKDFI